MSIKKGSMILGCDPTTAIDELCPCLSEPWLPLWSEGLGWNTSAVLIDFLVHLLLVRPFIQCYPLMLTLMEDTAEDADPH